MALTKLVQALLASIILATTTSATRFALPIVPAPEESVLFGSIDIGHKLNNASIAGNGTFQQYIDHWNHSLGTFSQFYYYNATFWKPGGPVVVWAPQEIALDGYQPLLNTNYMTGVFAEAIGGAVILIEHRYWGYSSPYPVLTAENLRFLTLNQSIADLNHFAATVKLPFDPHKTSVAAKAPWVLYGGSYAGALTAWVASVAPGTFWAYVSTSGVVEAISNFWEYFVPETEYMPQNCSTDIQLVIEHVDSVLNTGTDDDITALKTMFMMENVTHNVDFADALANGPYLWQDTDFDYNAGFFDFCDYVENAHGKNATIPDSTGVGLKKALSGYAKWFRTEYLPGACEGYGYQDFQGTYNVNCFNTFNASSPIFTDTSVLNAVDRQWEWYLCNQPFGYWQTGAPQNQPTIVSRLVDVHYWTRQCGLFFPTVNGYSYGIAEGDTEAQVNAYTKGWDFKNTTRLLWVEGQADPWREATVASDFRPGGPLQSTPEAPVLVIPGGRHCSDVDVQNGNVNAGVAAVQAQEVAYVKQWVSEWPGTS